MSQTLLFRQDAANRLGINYSQLDRLRAKGLIPEAVPVGHYFLFPAEKLDAIRARLVAAGKIRPKAKAGSRATA